MLSDGLADGCDRGVVLAEFDQPAGDCEVLITGSCAPARLVGAHLPRRGSDLRRGAGGEGVETDRVLGVHVGEPRERRQTIVLAPAGMLVRESGEPAKR